MAKNDDDATAQPGPLGMSGGVPAGELLPCPKCNGEGQLRVSNDGEVEWVRCKSCQHEGAVHWTAEKAIAAWNTRATPAPPSRDADVERAISEAIGKSDAAFGYSFNLTRLVDGEETHTLTMPGFDPVDFEDRDEGYALIAERRNALRAAAIRAALQALG